MSDFSQQKIRHAGIVDRYSRYIQSPVLRLKFLNNALKIEPPGGLLTKAPFIGSLSYRALLIIELSKVMPPDQPAPFSIKASSLLYRFRFAVYGACVVCSLTLIASLVYVGSKVINSLTVPTQARGIAPQTQIATEAPGAKAVEAIGSEAGLSLDKVWLAEQGEGYEFYSNGARVLTEFETAGSKRSFYRFSLNGLKNNSDEAEMLSNPVGIVYHLSENDQLPFSDNYNSSLQDRSRALLEYARQHRLYNYVIDRFGRTYRIVQDEFASNHAGNSVWSDGSSAYVNLSAGFIGVCFEGKSEAGAAVGPDRINEAQIYAARVLTAVLRSKYEIADANCVTHGLVSMNPSNRLMGYHTDWVYGFPFEALGLSNKNETELLAVSHFGFSYDQAYLSAAGGKKWAGLDRADRSLVEEAKKNGLAVEEERRACWKNFQRLQLKQRALEQTKALSAE